MQKLAKICKKHGQLDQKDISLNRISPKGRVYLRCRICRNARHKDRLNRTRYLHTPRKHIKHKLPDFVKEEDKSHAYTILHRFKVTAQEYKDMLEKQNHVCAICKQPETMIKRKSNKIKMLAIDHCHKTGKIRGLLCQKCNVGIGSLKDSIELLKSAINYLELFGGCE